MNRLLKKFAWIAIDLGAESGRVGVAWLEKGQRFGFEEVHRFSHGVLVMPSGWHWDITGIWREILAGMEMAGKFARERQLEVRSVGVDAWGVDWCLLDGNGELLGLPHAYRDPRNPDAWQELTRQLSPREIFDATGIQVMPINTLFSLRAMSRHSPDLVRAAKRLLFLPDLFHYWLSGEASCEATVASTSQLLDARTRGWQPALLSLAGLSERCLLPVSEPGTVLGNIRPEVASETGLANDVRVILPASHDTGSAVAAIPAGPDKSWCFLSSGTWSLLGAEIDEPCMNEHAARWMFTNELGVGGTTRFLKNIAGLWLVQQCRREFSARDPWQDYDYAELTDLASMAEPFRTVVNPDEPVFSMPGNILEKIDAIAIATGQPVPETPGDYVRCCLESLALVYRLTLEHLETALDRHFDRIHVVGGGSLNRLLCQMTANATERTVLAGPAEATAIGNALVQALGDGAISDLDELRTVTRNTTAPVEWYPRLESGWEEAQARLADLIPADGHQRK
jgi:rhamnulokinase